MRISRRRWEEMEQKIRGLEASYVVLKHAVHGYVCHYTLHDYPGLGGRVEAIEGHLHLRSCPERTPSVPPKWVAVKLTKEASK